MSYDEASRSGRRSALHGSAWLTLANLLSKGCQTAITLVLATLLNEREMGLTAYAAALINVGVIIQSMGANDVIARTDRNSRRMAGTVQTLSVTAAVAITLIVVLFRDSIARTIGAPDAGALLALVSLSLPFFAISGAQFGLAHSEMQFRRRVVPDLVSALVNAGVSISLAIAGFGAYALATGIVVGAAIQPIVGAMGGIGVRFAWDGSLAREAIGWIRIVGPGAILAIVIVNLDYPLIGAILGPEDVGQYSLAFRIVWMPYISISVAIAAASFPLYVRLLRVGSEGFRQAVERVTQLAIILLGGTYLVLALLASDVVLLGQRWEPAALIIVLLVPYGFLTSVNLLWFEGIRAAGKPNLYLVLQITHLVVLAALLGSLTHMGVLWAAICQSIASMFLTPLTYIALRRSGARLSPRAIIWPLCVLVVGAAACVVALAVTRALGLGGDPSLLSFVIEAVIVAAAYCGLVALIDRQTISTIKSFVPGVKLKSGARS